MIRSIGDKKPKIAESAFISEAAYIIGDVEIGENSSVWPGAVIRGDSGKVKIGEYTAVEDNCVIHSGGSPTRDITIGDSVQIGHGAVINCHKIGDKVLIGMNSTLLHGAEIGNICIIGSGCLVSQGMKIPDNSFVVGIPGKIKGKSSPSQLRWVENVPQYYAKLAQQYKEQGL